MSSLKRSESACDACCLGKRACDKALPGCRACVSRGRTCRYDLVASRKRTRRFNVGPRFVPLEITTTTLSAHVHHVIQQVDPASNQEIGRRYLVSFRQWLPIISMGFLDRTMASHAHETDFSVWIFAMWLTTTLPLVPRLSSVSRKGRKPLYALAKSLYAQAQAECEASLLLLQASLVIATFEYVSRLPQQAYITLHTSMGMARALGLDLRWLPTDTLADGPVSLQREEARVAWAIIMLERIILAEIDRSLSPLTELPEVEIEEEATLSPASPLRRQVQTITIIDQAVQTAAQIAFCEESALIESERLDRQARHLLASIMHEDSTTTASLALPMALCLRALFVIHNAVLGSLPAHGTVADEETRQRALAALDTVAEMIYDVVCSRQDLRTDTPLESRSDTESISICCHYNLAATISHFERRMEMPGSPPALTQRLKHLRRRHAIFDD